LRGKKIFGRQVTMRLKDGGAAAEFNCRGSSHGLERKEELSVQSLHT